MTIINDSGSGQFCRTMNSASSTTWYNLSQVAEWKTGSEDQDGNNFVY